MKLIEWSDSLSVGIGLVDQQHQMLIQRLNELSKAINAHQGPSEFARTLGFLIEYTHFHFSEEEQQMSTYHYPDLGDHKLKHQEFVDSLNHIEKDFEEDGATHVLAASMDTLLVNWLVNHIQQVDQQFGDFLKERGIVIPAK